MRLKQTQEAYVLKINQFAYVPTDLPQIKKELADIRFLDPRSEKIAEPLTLFKQLLLKFFLESQSLQVREEKLGDLMATKKLPLPDYTSSASSLSKNAFYNVALQLLQFQVSLDFDLDKPVETMEKLGLPTADIDKQDVTKDQLIQAWYLLLNTRTKNGQLLIDYLAGQGYYHQFKNIPKPLLFNGKSQAVFDTDKLIREVVYVESSEDSDHDGKLDLIKAEVIRPSETNSGLKVPVVYTASPYDQGTNDKLGEQLTHDVNEPLAHKKPNKLKYKDISVEAPDEKLPTDRKVKGTTDVAEESFAKTWTYALNDFLLARGFAVVYSAGIGTSGSDGVRTTGDWHETKAVTSVIEWLHGDRTAFTNHTDNIAIKAWWSNKNIGMIGRSYLGTNSTAAAMTGVAGLKTAVVEAGISNWYDYYRENGLTIAPGGFQGEDTDVLAALCFSRMQQAGDFHKIQPEWDKELKKLTKAQNRKSGSYDQFWDARNLMKHDNTKIDMLLVHGLNDWNVKLSNVFNLREELKKRPITQKIILHQGQHEYLNNFRSVDYSDIVNLWLTNKLLGYENNANALLPEVIVQDNTKEDTWTPYKDWGDDAKIKKVSLSDKWLKNIQGNSSFNDKLPKKLFDKYIKNTKSWRKQLYKFDGSSTKLDERCIRLLSKPLKKDIVIDGQISFDLKLSSSQNVGLLSAVVVDYGKAKRLTEVPTVLSPQQIITGYHWRKDDLKEFTFQKKATQYKKISDGHINLQNRENSYRSDEIKPGKKYQVEFKLQPEFFRVLKGHRIGILLFATDMDFTIRGNQDITYSLDLDNSYVSLPLLNSSHK